MEESKGRLFCRRKGLGWQSERCADPGGSAERCQIHLSIPSLLRRKSWTRGISSHQRIPLVDDDLAASVLGTRSGRLLTHFSDDIYGSDFPNLICGVDGLQWSDIAAEGADASRMSTARRLCRDMMGTYKKRRTEEALRAYERNPNTIQSIPLKREIEREKR